MYSDIVVLYTDNITHYMTKYFITNQGGTMLTQLFVLNCVCTYVKSPYDLD